MENYELVEIGFFGSKNKPAPTAASAAAQKKSPVAMVYLQPSRTAFYAALNLNFAKLAEKLDRAIKKDRPRVETWWKKFGGEFDKLQKAIQTGLQTAAKNAAKKAAKVSGVDSDDSGGYMGEPITLTAALAAATPVVVAVVSLLKDMKVTDAAEQAAEAQVTGELRGALSKDPNVAKGEAEMPEGSDVAAVASSAGGGIASYLKNPVVLIGGGAVLLYFLTRKS